MASAVPSVTGFAPATRPGRVAAIPPEHSRHNDFQVVMSLIGLEGRRCTDDGTRKVLNGLGERVIALARARRTFDGNSKSALVSVLSDICAAHVRSAEPRDIVVALAAFDNLPAIGSQSVLAAGMAVNELVTNAVRHGFPTSGGRVTVSVGTTTTGKLLIEVADDGVPFPFAENMTSRTGGLFFARKLILAAGGTFRMPVEGSKVFRLTFG